MMGAYVTSEKWILGRLTGYDGCVRDEREVYPVKAHRI